MYPNLEAELKRKNISTRMLEMMLGLSNKSIHNKLSGSTEFTLPEVMILMELLPEFKLSYLFAKKEEETT